MSGELQRRNLAFMVIGGFANYVWGDPRLTTDLDVSINLGVLGADSIVELVLKSGGTVLPADPVKFAERARVLPIKDKEGVRVDFMLATLSFEFEAIERARQVDIDGVKFPICRPEDLIVYKLVSERARDHDDIVGVLRHQRGRLDLAAIDTMAEELASGMEDPGVAERWAWAKREVNG